MAKRPLDILHGALNQKVLVELRGGRRYRGLLGGYDHPHLNLVLQDVEEIVDGHTTRKSKNVLLRGDSIIYIVP
jgi:small nuclear ribonucleoprotein